MSGLEHVHWSQIRIGSAVTLAAVATAILVFFIDDVRDAVEDRYSLFFHTFTTQTLRPRAPVWLAGQPVGHVQDLLLEAPTRERGELLLIELSISASARPFITEGAAAQIISSSLLGEAVVNIIPASVSGRPLLEGEELETASELDPFQVQRKLKAVYGSVQPIADRWREVAAQLRNGRGTLPQLMQRPEQILELQSNLHAMAAALDTIGIAAGGFADLFGDPDVRSTLDRLGPRVRQLAEQWGGQAGSVGAFAADTILEGRFSTMTRAIDRIVERLESGRGTLGRLLYDRALAQELAETRELLQELRAELETAGLGKSPTP